MSHLRSVHDPELPAVRGERPTTPLSVRAEAPGKVNLLLRVGAPGPDGYHPLTTVFQAVRLIETVTARRQAADRPGEITLTLAEPDDRVPLDETNLAVRAAHSVARLNTFKDGVDLTLRKRVPVAGGMAGGSADAAATLLACTALWALDLRRDELHQVAAGLGADVPFLLMGATAVGHGRGDVLTPLMTRGTYSWVLALAEDGLSTPAVFRRLDELRAASGRTPQTGAVPEAMTSALRTGDPVALAPALANDLQEAALSLRPELADTIAAAEEAGALRAIVSGSGPTVAALAPDEATAQVIASDLEASGTCARVIRTTGPVPGARLVG